MNARQKCKKLKQRNKMLMNIVNSNPEFSRIYNDYTKNPFQVKTSHAHLQTYVAKSLLEPMLGNKAIEFAEEHIMRELSIGIKQNVEWEIIDHGEFGKQLEGRLTVAEGWGD